LLGCNRVRTAIAVLVGKECLKVLCHSNQCKLEVRTRRRGRHRVLMLLGKLLINLNSS
jgi:hypothetical protein